MSVVMDDAVQGEDKPVTGHPPAHAPRQAALDRFRRLARPVGRAYAWTQRTWGRFPNAWFLYPLLLAITALAGFLRFWRIDHQSYWHDEAKTLYRISGSLDHMLVTLADQGFPPGWYLLLRWWTVLMEWYTGSAAQAFAPSSTRALTALMGTLMVVGMYFLARQFTDRKGALLVMLLAAVNPFLIYYSRDIKMYAACWMFLTFHVALFFQWQTSHRHWLWWPLFTLTGVAAVCMHASAWFVVALELVWLFTRPRGKSFDVPLWVVTIGCMALIPIYWYQERSIWLDRMMAGGFTGLEWIEGYTDMSWKTVASLPSSHLLGFLWPEFPVSQRTENWFGLGRDFTQHLATRTDPVMPWNQWYAMLAVGLIMLVGLFPWRGIRRSAERDASATRARWWWVALWIVIPMGILAATWLPEGSDWSQRIWGTLGINQPKPIWEPRYLGIVAPAFMLWLAASIRRLPTFPIRTAVLAGVVAMCSYSALSNHYVYRQAPWQPTAAAAGRFGNMANPRSIAIGMPATRFPGDSEIYHLLLLENTRITPEGHPRLAWVRQLGWSMNYNPLGLYDWQYEQFLDSVRRDPEVQTIVLTDRLGDLTQGNLTNDRLARRMRGWTLVHEETYLWQYEWRFNIFHTWRTRVWTRTPPATQAAPAR